MRCTAFQQSHCARKAQNFCLTKAFTAINTAHPLKLPTQILPSDVTVSYELQDTQKMSNHLSLRQAPCTSRSKRRRPSAALSPAWNITTITPPILRPGLPCSCVAVSSLTQRQVEQALTTPPITWLLTAESPASRRGNRSDLGSLRQGPRCR